MLFLRRNTYLDDIIKGVETKEMEIRVRKLHLKFDIHRLFDASVFVWSNDTSLTCQLTNAVLHPISTYKIHNLYSVRCFIYGKYKSKKDKTTRNCHIRKCKHPCHRFQRYSISNNIRFK